MSCTTATERASYLCSLGRRQPVNVFAETTPVGWVTSVRTPGSGTALRIALCLTRTRCSGLYRDSERSQLPAPHNTEIKPIRCEPGSIHTLTDWRTVGSPPPLPVVAPRRVDKQPPRIITEPTEPTQPVRRSRWGVKKSSKTLPQTRKQHQLARWLQCRKCFSRPTRYGEYDGRC